METNMHIMRANYLMRVAQEMMAEAQQEMALAIAESVDAIKGEIPMAVVVVKPRRIHTSVLKKMKVAKTKPVEPVIVKPVDNDEPKSYTEELVRNIAVMNEFPVEYTGKAEIIAIHMATFVNKGQEFPYMDRNYVMIEVYDVNHKRLNPNNCFIHKDKLVKYGFLVKKGLYQFTKKGTNQFIPNVVELAVN